MTGPPLPHGATSETSWTTPDGGHLAYTAEAAWMALRDDDDEPVADIFSVSYTVEHFAGGHMFYAWEDSRVAFRDAIATFYESALT